MKIRSYNVHNDFPRVIISSGWHGDEPDGINILNNYYFPKHTDCNIITLNEINEWGCRYGIRTDRNGLSPDDGFTKRDEQYQQVMSVEAKSIKALEPFINKYEYHIAIHNDPAREGYYFYTWGNLGVLEKEGDTYFKSVGLIKTFDTFKNLKDGSYYDYMYSRYNQSSIIIETGITNESERHIEKVLELMLKLL